MDKRIFLVVGVLLPILVFPQGRKFSYVERRIYDPLDPYTYTPNPANDRLSSLLFSKLFSRDDEAKPVKDMVKDLAVDPKDARTAIITLNSGMKWSDGTPVTADDVVFTIEYLKDNANQLNADELLRPRLLQIEKAMTTKPNQLKVRFKFDKTMDVWEQCLIFSVLPKKLLNGKVLKPSSTFSANPVGNGPFRLEEVVGGSAFRLDRNPSYHGSDSTNQEPIDNIVAYYEPDDNFRIEKLKSGRADLVVEVPWDAVPILKGGAAGYEVRPYESLTYYYLGCNLRNEALGNQLVREAISLALDRVKIISLAFNGAGKCVSGPYPPTSEYTDPDVNPDPYDPSRAIQLLQKAGYGDRKPLPKLRLVYPQEEGSYGNALRTVCVAIEGFLRNVGVQVVLEPIPSYSLYLDQIFKERSFDLALDRWRFYDHLGDPSELFLTGGRYNYIEYKNAEADNLIREFRTAGSVDKKILWGRKLHQLIAKDRPYVFLFEINNHVAWNRRRLRGAKINPFNFFGTIPHWKIRD
jgi:peptide/nickel transport system substrate-binding protein